MTLPCCNERTPTLEYVSLSTCDNSGSVSSPCGTPSASSCSNASPDTIVTPSLTALSYFDPGLSPATTTLVFFETEEVIFPPRALTAAAALSRVCRSEEHTSELQSREN